MGNTLGLGVILSLGLGVGVNALTQAVGPNAEHLQRGREAHANRVVNPQHQHNAEDIDESSAERFYDAMRYAKVNAMLVQVPVLGTAKKFWRLSDKATRVTRKLALILMSQHSVGKYLAAPLLASNVWIGSNGSVRLRGVNFTAKGFSIERVREDYKHLFMVLLLMIYISGGDFTKLPPDYTEFLELLCSKNLTMEDEFLIVNNAALLPMKNRIVNYLRREDRATKKRILSNLPYKNDWLDTARANSRINQWTMFFRKKGINQGVENVGNEYRRTPLDLLRLNRNIRCHLHQYDNDDIEETLYCEWPELLMVMEKMLHLEGELVATDIQNKSMFTFQIPNCYSNNFDH